MAPIGRAPLTVFRFHGGHFTTFNAYLVLYHPSFRTDSDALERPQEEYILYSFPLRALRPDETYDPASYTLPPTAEDEKALATFSKWIERQGGTLDSPVNLTLVLLE